MKRNISLLIGLSLYTLSGFAIDHRETLDLSGNWHVEMSANESMQKQYGKGTLSADISLPGSTAQNHLGYKTTGSDYGILTPEYKYVGVATYTREIEIPKTWKGKEITLKLDRVLWRSTLYVDGKKLDSEDGLGVPHLHHLGQLASGKHTVTIEVDNRMIYNIGDKGHAYGEYTQSIWNGVVGNMTLEAHSTTFTKSIRTFSDLSAKVVKVESTVFAPKAEKVKLVYSIMPLNSDEKIVSKEYYASLNEGENPISHDIKVDQLLQAWSEFHPTTYRIAVKILHGKKHDVKIEEFGYRTLSHDGTHFLVNGEPIFLRGNLDCVHFPITGYPSCSVEEWMEIFKIYKSYGLNHARFHTWCPPEAAFKAADRVGIYIQAEASVWIDWWMSQDMIKEGRPEMDTQGHPKGVGNDPERDLFIKQEMKRMVDAYGNHPSFVMMGIGNELGNANFPEMEKWIAQLKEYDSRRLYAASTARVINPSDDYAVTHYIDKVGGTRGLKGPTTDWDFQKVYSQMDIPIVAHEVGQWPVYPRWTEIEKYQGVLKARNLEEMHQVAIKNGIEAQDEEFVQASGALNQLMYKNEMESFLRTQDCAGFQLLSLQDYQGQGEALIGWLDCFWQSKHITTPKAFREHSNSGVPLLRIPKFVYENNEKIQAQAQFSYFGEKSVKATTHWSIENSLTGEILKEESFGNTTLERGSVTDLGAIDFDLKDIDHAEQLTLKVWAEGTGYQNHWDVWIYPHHDEKSVEVQKRAQEKGVLEVSQWNDETLKLLSNGATVLLDASQLGDESTSVNTNFYPLYWSLTFFPGQGKTCIGMWINEHHSALSLFPTQSHTHWQWEKLCKEGRGFVLNDLSKNYKGIVQPIDDFHRNNKIGSIFELKVGEGKLLVSGFDLSDTKNPVKRALHTSLLNYVASTEFQPTESVDVSWLKKTFAFTPQAQVADLPKEFKNAILYVKAAEKDNTLNESVEYTSSKDEVVLNKECSYTVNTDGMWADDTDKAWYGRKIKVKIDLPNGVLGTLYVHFSDWNKNGRTGKLTFEGRKSTLGKHTDGGEWIAFHVMREDSNDGEIVLEADVDKGPNLMITDLVLLKE